MVEVWNKDYVYLSECLIGLIVAFFCAVKICSCRSHDLSLERPCMARVDKRMLAQRLDSSLLVQISVGIFAANNLPHTYSPSSARQLSAVQDDAEAQKSHHFISR